MKPNYDICVVDDCPSTRRLLEERLARAGFAVRQAADGAEAWELITRDPPKVILSDWYMPKMDGLALCSRLREHADLGHTFFVLMTAHDEEGSKTLALCSGADDYLAKPIDPDELIARMRVGTRVWVMQEKLRQAAITDGLTGLYNHDHFTRVVEQEMNRSRRYGGSLSFIMIDLDRFKMINDTYGHLVGNDVLEQVASTLRATVREVDSIGRFGGDEFAIVAPESPLADAVIAAERIRAALAVEVRLEKGIVEAQCGSPPSRGGGFATSHEWKLRTSIGVSSTDDLRVKSAADLIDLADRAMYIAKRKGRNQVTAAADVAEDDTAPESLIQTDEVDSLRKQVASLSVQAKEIYMESIASLVQALDEKDPYTARHSANVSFFAERIARFTGCSEGMVATIRNAAIVHDIGKVGIPDRILTKPGPLTSLEWAAIRQVPVISARIVDPLRILESERQIVRHQREHFDGSGIPDGLKGDAIPIGARIVLVADAFDAMTTDRVYRPRRTIEQAQTELREKAERQFDPQAVNAVEHLIAVERREWERRIDETIHDFPIHSNSDAVC